MHIVKVSKQEIPLFISETLFFANSQKVSCFERHLVFRKSENNVDVCGIL